MNIIETVRSLLEDFPKISQVCNEIHIDFADPVPTSYGLTSTGDSVISEDVLGNQTRRHTFELFSTFSGINDFERLTNSSALTELAQWLSEKRDIPITNEVDGLNCAGVLLSVRAENGSIEEVPQSNIFDGLLYHLQIVADYTVEFN